MGRELAEKANELRAAATPGAWRCTGDHGHFYVLAKDGDHEKLIAETDARDRSTAMADAVLMAAAPALADLAEQQATDIAAANASILKLRAEVEEQRAETGAVRAAWEAEHSMGGSEPEPALTCMLLALKAIRDQKQGMEDGFRTLIAERDAARSELARIKGAGLAETIQPIAERHDFVDGCSSTRTKNSQEHKDRATLLDAVRVLTAERDEQRRRAVNALHDVAQRTDEREMAEQALTAARAEVETLRKNRDALAHGEAEALKMMAAEKQRAEALSELVMESNPIGWAGAGQLDAADAWQKKADQILKAVPR